MDQHLLRHSGPRPLRRLTPIWLAGAVVLALVAGGSVQAAPVAASYPCLNGYLHGYDLKPLTPLTPCSEGATRSAGGATGSRSTPAPGYRCVGGAWQTSDGRPIQFIAPPPPCKPGDRFPGT